MWNGVVSVLVRTYVHDSFDEVFISEPILHFTSYQNTYVIDMEEEGKSTLFVATLDDE